jgi:transposase
MRPTSTRPDEVPKSGLVLFKDSLWAWRIREDHLSEEEAAVRSRLLMCRHLQTGWGCMLLEAFREIFRIPDVATLESRLREWCRWAHRSRIPEMKKPALTVKEHLSELLAFTRIRLSNAPAEALNGFIQPAKRKSRGFGHPYHFRASIFCSPATFILTYPIRSRHPHSTPTYDVVT